MIPENFASPPPRPRPRAPPSPTAQAPPLAHPEHVASCTTIRIRDAAKVLYRWFFFVVMPDTTVSLNERRR
ncbi:hypothetical protein LshimejAT787_0111760 [Lyophyllum shimeji]|uniref:Uncharacterized protein n=1 Tax=Lyophyllum shimeji TaxID=47721 RepID=A0A9P3PF48_LYOSH|nr:hypothetical protein LshimejAT787_0111760 [Lyophyllum shimeji]